MDSVKMRIFGMYIVQKLLPIKASGNIYSLDLSATDPEELINYLLQKVFQSKPLRYWVCTSLALDAIALTTPARSERDVMDKDEAFLPILIVGQHLKTRIG